MKSNCPLLNWLKSGKVAFQNTSGEACVHIFQVVMGLTQKFGGKVVYVTSLQRKSNREMSKFLLLRQRKW